MSLLERIADPKLLSSVFADLQQQAKKKPALQKKELAAFDINQIQTISQQLLTRTYEPSPERVVYQLKQIYIGSFFSVGSR